MESNHRPIRPRRRKSKKRRMTPTASAGTSTGTGNGGEGVACTTNRQPLHDVSLSTTSPVENNVSKRRRETSASQQQHVPTPRDDETPPRRAAFDPRLMLTAPGLVQAREMGMLSRIVGKQKRRRMQSQPQSHPQQQILDDIWNHSGQWFKTLMLCRPPCTGRSTTTTAASSDSQQAGPRSRQRWEWKPHIHRSIPFRALDTSPNYAVLALSRDASYVIALGGGACSGTSAAAGKGKLPILALRFYGVPSPARLNGETTRKREISPLFLTIPLLMDAAESAENRNLGAPSALLGESSGHAAANTPVRMLFTRDGCLGVAIVLHSAAATEASPALPSAAFVGSPAVQDEDALGTVFVFPLPGNTDRFNRREYACVKSLKCSNVRVTGNLRSHTFRNMLWPTRSVPLPASTCQNAGNASGWCHGFCKVPSNNSYLLLNDEDDGYRMTWLVLGSDDASRRGAYNISPESTPFSSAITTKRSDIICKPDYGVWESIRSDRFTGCIFSTSDSDGECEEGEEIHVRYESFLSIEALLSDIMARRKKMFASCSSLPNYFYNLISMSDDGRVITLILVFALGKFSDALGGTKQRRTPAAIGLFLQYDIFNNAYVEMEWVQHPTLSDARFLRSWCNTLALNWQMREKKIGLYSVPRDDSSGKRTPLLQNQTSKAIRFHDDDSRGDELDDFDPSVWRSSVHRGDQERSSLPLKHVSMSSLYPFCDVVCNKAVVAAEPVMRIGCRDAPIELSYS